MLTGETLSMDSSVLLFGRISDSQLLPVYPVKMFPVLLSYKTNRIYHPSSMQTEKSQPEGKRIMAETRFTEFPALFVDPRVVISWSAKQI